ncbi:hypothetical protein [Natronorubrum halophilum]|uniref:hypothetical protein n=1 Tax=Natronorubrum halophilum TaxID=1702106 RepID=UPI000EF70D6D|nr:hypothetical protein [Natronorubrum halophilum]
MGSTQRTNDSETISHIRESVLEPLFGSILLKIAAAGVVFIVLGAFLNGGGTGDGELMGIWSAIFAVWGAGLVLVGLGLYTFVWWRRR